MFARCANPSCGRQLHSFAEARVFQFEVVSISVSASDDTTAPFDEKPKSEIAHFWLCGRCAASMSLVLEPVSGLKLVPLGAKTTDVADLSLGLGRTRETDSC